MTDESNDVLTTVRRKYDELTNSQKRIAEAIVEDPEFVAFATVDKLSERLGVAPSTVVRFAYRIGFGGYPDLQERVRRVVRNQMRGAQTAEGEVRVSEHLSEDQAASLERDMDNLRQTVLGLEQERLSEAVEMLSGARQIFVAGGYASGALASYAGLLLERTRDHVFLIESRGGRNIPPLFRSNEQDVLLAFGFAPYSTDTVEVIELAKERGQRLIGVTDTPISPIGQRVDVVLATRVSGVGAQNSLVGPLAVVNALVNGLAATLPDSVSRYEYMMRSLDSWGRFVLSGQDGTDAG